MNTLLQAGRRPAKFFDLPTLSLTGPQAGGHPTTGATPRVSLTKRLRSLAPFSIRRNPASPPYSISLAHMYRGENLTGAGFPRRC